MGRQDKSYTLKTNVNKLCVKGWAQAENKTPRSNFHQTPPTTTTHRKTSHIARLTDPKTLKRGQVTWKDVFISPQNSRENQQRDVKVHRVCKWTLWRIWSRLCSYPLWQRCPPPCSHVECHWAGSHGAETLSSGIPSPGTQRNKGGKCKWMCIRTY